MEQSFIVDGIVKWYKAEKQFGNFAKLTNRLAFSLTSPLLSTREVKTYVDKRVVQYCSQKALFRITSPWHQPDPSTQGWFAIIQCITTLQCFVIEPYTQDERLMNTWMKPQKTVWKEDTRKTTGTFWLHLQEILKQTKFISGETNQTVVTWKMTERRA